MNTSRWQCALVFASGLVLLPLLRAESLVDDPGRFTVNLAAPYERSTKDVETAAGKTKMFLLVHATETQGYFVTYNDYAPGSMAGTDRAATYERVIKGVAEGMKGSVRSGSDHQLGDVGGREYIIDIAKMNLAARERCYLVGDRLYQVMYLGPVGSEGKDEVLQFLNSFRLLR
jgi:hypothetical protein